MTSQVRDPLRDLIALQDRMSRLFEDSLRGRAQEEEVAGGKAAWTPPADVYEREGMLVVSLELPGVKREQVEIRVENNLLTVQGERSFPEGVNRQNFHRMERSYGRFFRTFTLPAGISQEGIEATHRNGLLTIRIQISEETTSRQIEIK